MNSTPSIPSDEGLVERLKQLRIVLSEVNRPAAETAEQAADRIEELASGHTALLRELAESSASLERITNASQALLMEIERLRDALLVIEDVWTIPSVSSPDGRKWHCQHEETLWSASAFARAALSRPLDEQL